MLKKTTLDDLAAMVARGFETTATKDDLKELATKTELAQLREEMHTNFQSVNARLDLIRHDIAGLPAMREGLDSLRQRVARLEERAGLTA